MSDGGEGHNITKGLGYAMGALGFLSRLLGVGRVTKAELSEAKTELRAAIQEASVATEQRLQDVLSVHDQRHHENLDKFDKLFDLIQKQNDETRESRHKAGNQLMAVRLKLAVICTVLAKHSPEIASLFTDSPDTSNEG